MHPNRQFPPNFVVHMPSCLHVLFRVARPLHSNWGCEGTVIWVGSLGGAREPLRPAAYYARGGGGTPMSFTSLPTPVSLPCLMTLCSCPCHCVSPAARMPRHGPRQVLAPQSHVAAVYRRKAPWVSKSWGPIWCRRRRMTQLLCHGCMRHETSAVPRTTRFCLSPRRHA